MRVISGMFVHVRMPTVTKCKPPYISQMGMEFFFLSLTEMKMKSGKQKETAKEEKNTFSEHTLQIGWIATTTLIQ